MRIVALTCSNTEIVCALGCGHFLVGVDSHSDYPADIVSQLPRVGRDLDIEISKVESLKPDLVLASLTVPGHEQVIEGLAAAGLEYVAPEPTSLDDVYADIRLVGDLLGVPERADRVVAEMQAAISGEEPPAREASLLVQWWPKPVIAPGRLSWVNDLIFAAGAVNPLADREEKSAPLTDADVGDLDPDAVILSWCGVKLEKYRPDVVYRNPTWSNSTFVKNKAVYPISEEFLGRPSPRLVEGYRQLRQVVRAISEAQGLA